MNYPCLYGLRRVNGGQKKPEGRWMLLNKGDSQELGWDHQALIVHEQIWHSNEMQISHRGLYFTSSVLWLHRVVNYVRHTG